MFALSIGEERLALSGADKWLSFCSILKAYLFDLCLLVVYLYSVHHASIW